MLMHNLVEQLHDGFNAPGHSLVFVPDEPGLPPVKWSSAMLRKTEEDHGKQAPKAGRDCHEVTAG